MADWRSSATTQWASSTGRRRCSPATSTCWSRSTACRTLARSGCSGGPTSCAPGGPPGRPAACAPCCATPW